MTDENPDNNYKTNVLFQYVLKTTIELFVVSVSAGSRGHGRRERGRGRRRGRGGRGVRGGRVRVRGGVRALRVPRQAAAGAAAGPRLIHSTATSTGNISPATPALNLSSTH